jgi:Flp pilus assembly pilin Flp
MLRGGWTGRVIKTLASMQRRDDGQGLFEYVLIIALISLLAVTALQAFGGRTNNTVASVTDSLDQSVPKIAAEKPAAFLLRGYSDGASERTPSSSFDVHLPICHYQWLEQFLQASLLPNLSPKDRCPVLNQSTEPSR